MTAPQLKTWKDYTAGRRRRNNHYKPLNKFIYTSTLLGIMKDKTLERGAVGLALACAAVLAWGQCSGRLYNPYHSRSHMCAETTVMSGKAIGVTQQSDGDLNDLSIMFVDGTLIDSENQQYEHNSYQHAYSAIQDAVLNSKPVQLTGCYKGNTFHIDSVEAGGIEVLLR